MLFLSASGVIFAQKKDKKNKKSLYQNITTKFNILFNAKEIIKLSVEGLSQEYPYKFEQLLPVYLSPEESNLEALRGNMDLVIQKCDRIVEEKARSKYVDRAYLLKGVSNFYKGGYFLASEYFDYIASEYDSVKVTLTEAKAWKARCQISIKNYKAAHLALDSALQLMNENKVSRETRSLVYATAAQLAIGEEKYPEAIEYLQNALTNVTNSYDRIRWDYVLAQIYDRQNDPKNAVQFYDKVASSNANFNLSFNANLNKIRLEALQNPTEDLRTKALMRLTRDEKNEEFLDQIYYQIGNVYVNDRKFDLAIEQFKKSIQNSTSNEIQKGMSYLAIGDVSFQYKNDYLTAKNYYDTAINVLPKNYKNYSFIVRKANNLQDLAEYYSTIANQDTLQMLAKLPQSDQKQHIKDIATRVFKEKNLKDSLAQALYDVMNNPKNPNYNPYYQTNKLPSTGYSNFYFANRSTVQQGYMEFKRIWGSRPLVDNWRLSAESDAFATVNEGEIEEKKKQEAEEMALAKAKKDVLSGKEAKGIEDYIQTMTAQLPNTPQKLAISDKLIIESYFKMGNFYRDILEDIPNAIQAFESMMRRFPNNYRSAETYYSLYRMLVKSDPNKANTYREALMRNFPQTMYAKLVSDPNFAKNYKGELAMVYENYNQAFDQFMGKQYGGVIGKSTQALSAFPNNELAPQFDYLKAISIGHTRNIDSLISALNVITQKYPKDALVTPLVEKHVTFLKNNYDYYKPRPIALTDADDYLFFGLTASNDPVKKGYQMDDFDSFQRKEAVIQKALTEAKTKPKPVEKPVEKPTPVTPKKEEIIAKNEVVKPENSLGKVGQESLGTKPLTSTFDGPNTLATPKVDSSKLKADEAVLEGSVRNVGLGNVNLPANSTGINAKIQSNNSELLAALKAKFTQAPSRSYYYVINVFDETAVLNSSRFGIGQFIRTQYNDANITHKVLELDKNQLIYVGPFESVDLVRDFQKQINPMLSSIMKIGIEDYETFFITNENLFRIKNTNDTNDYVLFYNITLK